MNRGVGSHHRVVQTGRGVSQISSEPMVEIGEPYRGDTLVKVAAWKRFLPLITKRVRVDLKDRELKWKGGKDVIGTSLSLLATLLFYSIYKKVEKLQENRRIFRYQCCSTGEKRDEYSR